VNYNPQDYVYTHFGLVKLDDWYNIIDRTLDTALAGSMIPYVGFHVSEDGWAWDHAPSSNAALSFMRVSTYDRVPP
jgi:hypothetical protein